MKTFSTISDVNFEAANEPDDFFLKTAAEFGMEKLTTYWVKILMELDTSITPSQQFSTLRCASLSSRITGNTMLSGLRKLRLR